MIKAIVGNQVNNNAKYVAKVWHIVSESSQYDAENPNIVDNAVLTLAKSDCVSMNVGCVYHVNPNASQTVLSLLRRGVPDNETSLSSLSNKPMSKSQNLYDAYVPSGTLAGFKYRYDNGTAASVPDKCDDAGRHDCNKPEYAQLIVALHTVSVVMYVHDKEAAPLPVYETLSMIRGCAHPLTKPVPNTSVARIVVV